MKKVAHDDRWAALEEEVRPPDGAAISVKRLVKRYGQIEAEGFRLRPLMPEAGPQGLTAFKGIFLVDRAKPEYHRHEGEE